MESGSGNWNEFGYLMMKWCAMLGANSVMMQVQTQEALLDHRS
jgi:hypothetical protein